MKQETLKEWYLQYIKNRDIILRKINSIDEGKPDEDITINNKDDTKETAIINEEPNSFNDIIKNIKEEDKVNIIILNTKKNIDLMLKEWENLAKNKKLTIIFVNIDSTLDKRWIIKPYIHHRITEKSTLKSGIMSIAANVDFC